VNRRTVDEVSAGGRANPHLDPRIKALGLTEDEQRALVSFLEALTGEIREGR